MATIDKFIPQLIKFEGGYVNNPNDRGGATKYGVTLKTWRKIGYDVNQDGVIDEKDMEMLSEEDFKNVVNQYWAVCKANQIKNQSIASFIVDWAYNSGPNNAIKNVQRCLGLKDDGIIGPITLKAINDHFEKEYLARILFVKLKIARYNFIINIVERDESQSVFLKGWINRIDEFKFSMK